MKGLKCDDKISFLDFFLSRTQCMMEEELVLFCIITWRVWFVQRIHGTAELVLELELETVFAWSTNFIAGFMATNVNVDGPRGMVVNGDIGWTLPTNSYFKINCDTAIDVGNHVFGMGMVIPDHQGYVMASDVQRLMESCSPQVAEAVAVLYGLNFAIDTGLLQISVETDALVVVHLIN
ncbi:hypothetical protein Ddye_018831 [Dipteronia dyeriana]|uniref:RNase H type-1 domain-containing protein n=1 Tax=Dipteronia dyeriana TaxID=168575 RepID=A0AAD9WUH2_9ROSI|nr:hypothetical protein Ddye_018831 [Dipteronia dyeriana]